MIQIRVEEAGGCIETIYLSSLCPCKGSQRTSLQVILNYLCVSIRLVQISHWQSKESNYSQLRNTHWSLKSSLFLDTLIQHEQLAKFGDKSSCLEFVKFPTRLLLGQFLRSKGSQKARNWLFEGISLIWKPLVAPSNRWIWVVKRTYLPSYSLSTA